MLSFFDKYGLKAGKIAVGVSGGADSLALVLRLKQMNEDVVALTVDHGLRDESRAEAEYVATIMKQFDVDHHILTWTGTKPIHGIEEAAREARYNLLFDYCQKNAIKYLATGHHMRDQAETFLLRLARGSGVFGLSGILPVSEREGVTIIRPQLDITPEDLREYLKKLNVQWIEDPMNDMKDFHRVKIRKFLPQLKEIGIDEIKLAQTAAILRQTRTYLQSCCDEFLSLYVRYFGEKIATLPLKKISECSSEIARLVLGELIRKIGGENYVPEAESIKRIIDAGEDFKGCTLGGCELETALNKLWIIPQDKTNDVMSVAQWQKFVEKHEEFNNSGLPYKVRRAIWKNWKV